MTLATDHLDDLTEKINQRLGEFASSHLPFLSRGVVRLVLGVLEEELWQGATAAVEPADAPASAPVDANPLPVDATSNGHHEPEPVFDYTPHPPSRPLVPRRAPPAHEVGALPHPDTARANLATAIASGGRSAIATADSGIQTLVKRQRPTRPEQRARKEATATSRHRGVYAPALPELIVELKRQSMAGMMPTQAQFDVAKPANWATGAAQALRLKLSWDALAQLAGLTPKRRGNGDG